MVRQTAIPEQPRQHRQRPDSERLLQQGFLPLQRFKGTAGWKCIGELLGETKQGGLLANNRPLAPPAAQRLWSLPEYEDLICADRGLNQPRCFGLQSERAGYLDCFAGQLRKHSKVGKSF